MKNSVLSIKKKIIPVLKRHDVKRAAVFGSFAREEIQYYFIEKNNNIYQLSYIKGDKQLDPTFEKMVITFQLTN